MQYLVPGLLAADLNQVQAVKLFSRIMIIFTIKSNVIFKKKTSEQKLKDALNRQVEYMNQRDTLFNTKPLTSEMRVIYNDVKYFKKNLKPISFS
jgi:CDP-glycerol glycerophosphotransferase (TagB/SpsB family)